MEWLVITTLLACILALSLRVEKLEEWRRSEETRR
jgi:hypothetical protein